MATQENTDFFYFQLIQPRFVSKENIFLYILQFESKKRVIEFEKNIIMEWIHICLVVDIDENEKKSIWKTYINGKLFEGKEVFDVNGTGTNYGGIPANSCIVLGQEQDVFGGNFDADQSFAGKIAQFKIWSYPIRKL